MIVDIKITNHEEVVSEEMAPFLLPNYFNINSNYQGKAVFCKHFLEKVAKYFWRMLHLQIGESCKASAGSYPASHIAIADHI